MSNKRKAAFVAFIAAIVGALFFGVAGGAVTNADGGLPTQNQVLADGSRQVTNTNQTLTTGEDGNIQLVATGNTSRALVCGPWCPALNWWATFKIYWDDSPAGSSYKVTKSEVWNPGTVESFSGYVRRNNNVAYWHMGIGLNETRVLNGDTTGSAVSLFCMTSSTPSTDNIYPSPSFIALLPNSSDMGWHESC